MRENPVTVKTNGKIGTAKILENPVRKQRKELPCENRGKIGHKSDDVKKNGNKNQNLQKNS
jgi:hypothetical protein